MAASTNALAAGIRVKNTFIHLDEAEDDDRQPVLCRRVTLPASSRLAFGRKSSIESDTSTRGSEASAGSSPDISPMVSPRQQSKRWADITDDDSPRAAGQAVPPPPPPPQPIAVASSPTRTRLNAKAAAFQPELASRSAVTVPDKEAAAMRAQVSAVMEQLQATFDCCGKAIKINVLAGDTSQIRVVLWVSAEDEWQTESLLAATKEALLRAPSERTATYVLGYLERPFAPQPSGFSGVLAKMEDKSRACWETYKKGFCCKGSACRFRHPTRPVPISVVVATRAALAPPSA